MSHLITATDAIAALNDPDTRFFDATFVLPTMNRDAKSEFDRSHIPQAQFFDIDAIADPASDLPHMVPDTATFTQMMRALGICNHHRIIFYDNSPFLSSARGWWLLRLFGKQGVFVLDGGLPAYLAAGGTVVSGAAQMPEAGDFTPAEPLAHIMMFDALRNDIETGQAAQILDARPAPRFTGEAAEPRAGLRSGHMPDAMNVPITTLLDEKTGCLKDNDALTTLFQEVGFDFNRPAITSCGSGVTAAGLTLALAQLGKDDIALYDGSWAEWGASDAPIQTGE